MPLFRYKAINAHGKKEIGLMSADSITLAKEKLYRQKVLVTDLVYHKKKSTEMTLPPTLILNLTRDLYVLLWASLPLYDSLLILEEKYRRSKLHTLFLTLCDQIKEGVHLSEALATYPKVFSSVYVAMVKAGEESGTIKESFQELVALLGKQQAIKKKTISAMIYPIFLGVFCLVVLTVLLFFLIPAMGELFEGRTLHPMTESVLMLSYQLNTHATTIFVSLSIIITSIFFLFRRQKGQELKQQIMLHLPICKRLIVEMVFARFSRVFGVLLKRGVPLVESLKLSKMVMKNILFEKIMVKVIQDVAEGKRLSEELKKYSLVPTLVIRFLALSEESGNTHKMMEHLSEIYDDDIDRTLVRLTALLQPTMLLFLGLIVALILLSVLLPLTDMSSII